MLRLGYYEKAWNDITTLYGNNSQISYSKSLDERPFSQWKPGPT